MIDAPQILEVTVPSTMPSTPMPRIHSFSSPTFSPIPNTRVADTTMFTRFMNPSTYIGSRMFPDPRSADAAMYVNPRKKCPNASIRRYRTAMSYASPCMLTRRANNGAMHQKRIVIPTPITVESASERFRKRFASANFLAP
jgi:hypothetical protein